MKFLHLSLFEILKAFDKSSWCFKAHSKKIKFTVNTSLKICNVLVKYQTWQLLCSHAYKIISALHRKTTPIWLKLCCTRYVIKKEIMNRAYIWHFLNKAKSLTHLSVQRKALEVNPLFFTIFRMHGIDKQ